MTGPEGARERAEINRLGLQALNGTYRDTPHVVAHALTRIDAIGEHAWQQVTIGWANAAIHALNRTRGRHAPLSGPITYKSGQWQLRFASEAGRPLDPETVASPLDLITLRFIVAVGNRQYGTAGALAAAATTRGDRREFVIALLRLSVAINTANSR